MKPAQVIPAREAARIHPPDDNRDVHFEQVSPPGNLPAGLDPPRAPGNGGPRVCEFAVEAPHSPLFGLDAAPARPARPREE